MNSRSIYLSLITQSTLDKLPPNYSCLSLMTPVCLQQHISLNQETESPGWPSLLLSGLQHEAGLEQKTTLFLDKTKPEDMFQEHNDDDLATNWQSVRGNRLEQAQSNFPLNAHNEDIGPLAHWIFSTNHFTAQIHSHQAASVNRQIGQRTQNLERW